MIELNISSVLFEKGNADFVFETCDGFAESGWGNKKFFGGPRQMLVFGDFFKVDQMLPVHNTYLPFALILL